MADRIYLVSDGEQLRPMDQQPYDSEKLLQHLLGSYPDLLAGEQFDDREPRRWLLIRREMAIAGSEDGSGRWSLDHLFLDQDGVPTLVEVKRSSDTRIRREVVGQILDYAANAVVYWPANQIRTEFETARKLKGADPDGELRAFLNAVDADDEEDNIVEEFWQKVQTNLQAERIRLVFVADIIPRELARIVEFLNGQMNPAEVFALEVKQYLGDGKRVMVPALVGQTAKSRAKHGPASVSWDVPSLLAFVTERYGADAAGVIDKTLNWANGWAEGIWWSQSKDPWCYPWIWIDKPNGWYFAPFRFSGRSGTVRVEFRNIRRHPPFDQVELRRELFERVNRIEGVSLPGDSYIDKNPGFPISRLTNKEAYDQFIETWEWGNRVARQA